MSPTRQFIALISQPNKCPSAQDLRDLAYALHAAQAACDARELMWMSSTFEDMGDVMASSIKCAQSDEVTA